MNLYKKRFHELTTEELYRYAVVFGQDFGEIGLDGVVVFRHYHLLPIFLAVNVLEDSLQRHFVSFSENCDVVQCGHTVAGEGGKTFAIVESLHDEAVGRFRKEFEQASFACDR